MEHRGGEAPVCRVGEGERQRGGGGRREEEERGGGEGWRRGGEGRRILVESKQKSQPVIILELECYYGKLYIQRTAQWLSTC